MVDRNAANPAVAARSVAARRSWEKRFAYRAPVEIPVRYTLLSERAPRRALGLDDGRGASAAVAQREGLITDLSALGVRLFAAVELPPHAELSLELPLDGEPVMLHGRVVGARPDPARRRTLYGIAFVQCSEQRREALYRFVHRWQLERLRLLRGER